MSLKKLASLIIKINANGAQAQAELKTLEKKVDDFGKSMKRVGQNMTKYVTVPLAAIATASVAAANTQLQAEAKLLTALKGRDDVQKRLMKQASELQSRSLFGDEAIIEQQAYLAALGLSEQQINDTIEAAAQLSVALGMDLTSAVKNLAKTYSGMTGELGESIPALRNLTKEELQAGEAIKYVNDNYKGFAEAAAETGAGPLVQLKNKLGDLAEKVGVVLLPVLDRVVDVISRVVDWFSSLSPQTQEMIVKIAALAAAIGPLLIGISQLITALTTVKTILPLVGQAMTFLTSHPVAAAIAAFATLATVIATAGSSLKRLEEDMEAWKEGKYTDEYSRIFAEYSQPKYRDAELERWLAWYSQKLREHRDDDDDFIKRLYEEDIRAIKDVIKARENEGVVERKQRELAYAEYWLTHATTTEAMESFRDLAQRRREELNALLTDAKESTGIIEALQTRIQELEKRKILATSKEEISQINIELERLTAQLKEVSEYTTEKSIAKVPTIATSPINWGDVEMKGDFALEWGPLSQRNFEGWRKAQLERAERMVETVNEMNAILTEALVNFAETSFDMLADLFTGQEIKPLASFLEMIGNLLKQLGKALITYGGLIEAFRETFKNPWVSIAVGAAAIAAGAAFTALAKRPFAQNTVKLANGGLAYGPTMAVVGDNPGAANDPEVVAPLSKLRDYMGRQKLELTGEIEWEMRGDVLRAVLDRNNVRLATLG